jgi:uncharacterized protein YndB with AHSA1/START domain
MDDTTFEREAGFIAATTTRRLDHPAAAVWRMIAEPARMAEWLAPGRIEPRLGGEVRLDFADSGTVIENAVSAFEDGRLVAFSWSKPGEPLRPVRIALSPDGAGTQLTLTVKTPDGEDPARAAAGWAAHLAMLEAALAGAPIGFPFETFRTAREACKAKVAALGQSRGEASA